MERLSRQERDPSIRTLRTMLRALPSETRTENQWRILENGILARLEEEKNAKRPALWRIPWVHAMPSWSPMATAFVTVLLIAVVVVGTLDLFGTPGLEHASIVSAKGPVTISTASRQTTVAPRELPSLPLRAGQTIEIEEDGLAAVRLEEGTGIVLSAGAKLVVEEADQRSVRLMLSRGTLVAQVHTRAPDQSFEIRTGNARCRVLGTVFRVEAQQHATRLSVFKGRVEMTSVADTDERDIVEAGHAATLDGTKLEAPDALAEAQPPVREISILKLALDMPAEETPDTWGIVEIASTPPGASVVIGTEVVGKTPMVMVRPAGQTEIDLIHPDYPPQRRSLKVGHNEFLSFEHRLESNDTPSPSPRRTARRVARPPRREAKGGSDILENPHYIEALIHMTIGEYRKALALLDSLEERPETGHHDRKILADKRQECYRGLGDFRRALASHEQRYRTAPDTRAKAAALWQTATIRATCLGDYEGAERDLVNYIVSYPEGVWIEQAYLRLAEVQALQDDLRAAIETYRRHLKHFPHSAGRDKVLHALARLEGEGKRYSEAEKHYRLLLERHPQSRYAESALFYRAECLRTLNRDAEARTAYRAYLARYPQGHWRESCTRRLGRAHAMN